MDSDKSIELISKENDKQSEKDNIIDINTNKANKNDTTVLTNYQSTNILSQLFMTWASSILHYPKKDKLTFEHLPPLSKANDSSSFSSFLDNIWTTEGYSKHKTNALFKALIRANIWRFCLMFIMNIISSLTEYLMIILLKLMIEYFENKRKYSLFFLGISFLICQLINTFFSIHSQMKRTVIGIRAGFEINCFIFDKLLKASPSSYEQRATQGEIVTLIQFDATKFNWILQTGPNLIIHPILIVSYIYLLFKFFGLAFIGGFITLLLCVCVNYLIFKGYRNIEIEIMSKTDKRMKLTTEMLNNIKNIKIYNWEKEFLKSLSDIRNEEVSAIKKEMNLTSTSLCWYWFYPTLVSIVTIGIYQYLNDTFNLSTMLVGLAIFARLQN